MKRTHLTSIKMQKRLLLTLQQRVILDGYGMHGKSKWIIEAISDFLDLEDYPTYVDMAVDMEHLTEMVSVRIPDEMMQRIDDAMIAIRTRYPLLEGVKSNLIRASILQRLLRHQTSVTEVGFN